MKRKDWIQGLKKIVSVTFVLLGMFLVVSCSQKVPFLISSVVPSAQGYVKIKKDKNRNYVIDLNVIRLVEPARLTPPKQGYIVWMETANSGVKNIGQLRTSTGMMSKTLKSSLTTVTPFKPTGFFITGEDDLMTQFSSSVVLSTGSFSVK